MEVSKSMIVHNGVARFTFNYLLLPVAASLLFFRSLELTFSFSTGTIQWIQFGVLCQLVDVFGVCTNAVNIICFVKQGFKDPVNVSLLGLAVSDLCCLMTLIWTNICYTPDFSASDLPFDAAEFQYLTSAVPHVTFARVTAWITALIMLERCLCIIAPIKVKQIVTPTRVSVVIAAIYIVLLFSVAPVYIVNKLGLRFFPGRNKTIIGLVFTESRQEVEQVNFAVNNAAIPATAFVVIIVSTVTLAIKLNKNTKWRNESTKTGHNVSYRNQKVAKMVVMISTLFIACFIPVSVIFLANTFEPDLAFDGKYRHLLIIVAGIGLFMESINSSFNIFVYYNMSSNYKKTYNEIFNRNTRKNVGIHFWEGSAKSVQQSR